MRELRLCIRPNTHACPVTEQWSASCHISPVTVTEQRESESLTELMRRSTFLQAQVSFSCCDNAVPLIWFCLGDTDTRLGLWKRSCFGFCHHKHGWRSTRSWGLLKISGGVLLKDVTQHHRDWHTSYVRGHMWMFSRFAEMYETLHMSSHWPWSYIDECVRMLSNRSINNPVKPVSPWAAHLICFWNIITDVSPGPLL